MDYPESIAERYAEALDNDEPIEIEGFTLYPITMRDYRRFEAAKPAILIRQGSLPVKYAIMSYLKALYAMDYDAFKEAGMPLGFITGIITMFALSMRFPVDALLKQTKIEVSEQDERDLRCLVFNTGDMYLRLTPETFDRLRPILAAQNGLELPDETENIDLVEAEMDIAAQDSAGVSPDFRSLLASVARDQRRRTSEFLDWTIREFFELRDAIEREKMFTILKMAEYSGNVKFKDGNPCPSWCYDRKEKAGSMIAMSEFMSGPGSVASMR